MRSAANADRAHALNARALEFDFATVPMHYIPGEVMATHIINVMHLVLPEGERAMAQAGRGVTPEKGRFWPLQFVSASVRGVVPSMTTFRTGIPRYLAQSPAARAADA